MDNKSEKQTLIEEGTAFRGVLTANCKVIVKGGVEGELHAPSVEIAPTGVVTGDVKATRLHSRGSLAGSVDADEISLAGEVRSNTVIRARSLEVKLSAGSGQLEVTFGECILDVGDAAGIAADDVDGLGSRSTGAELLRGGRREPERAGNDLFDLASGEQ